MALNRRRTCCVCKELREMTIRMPKNYFDSLDWFSILGKEPPANFFKKYSSFYICDRHFHPGALELKGRRSAYLKPIPCEKPKSSETTPSKSLANPAPRNLQAGQVKRRILIRRIYKVNDSGHPSKSGANVQVNKSLNGTNVQAKKESPDELNEQGPSVKMEPVEMDGDFSGSIQNLDKLHRQTKMRPEESSKPIGKITMKFGHFPKSSVPLPSSSGPLFKTSGPSLTSSVHLPKSFVHVPKSIQCPDKLAGRRKMRLGRRPKPSGNTPLNVGHVKIEPYEEEYTKETALMLKAYKC